MIARSAHEPIDLGFLEAQTFGDRTLERELLALFVRQCRRLVPILAATGDAEARADAAHTLKGGAAAIGAVRVAALAEEVERTIGSPGGGSRLPGLLLALGAAVAAVEDAIARDVRAAA